MSAGGHGAVGLIAGVCGAGGIGLLILILLLLLLGRSSMVQSQMVSPVVGMKVVVFRWSSLSPHRGS